PGLWLLPFRKLALACCICASHNPAHAGYPTEEGGHLQHGIFLLVAGLVSYLLASARIDRCCAIGLPHKRANWISISTGCSM
ncbi:unnamed protein product, partial [Clonostachys solani]